MASTIKVTNVTTPDGSGSITVDRPLINTGDFTVTSGDLVFSTAAKGVCLGVTSNTDANTLDDYEEGTWTPVLNAPGNASYTEQTGAYTKIGNVVNIWGTLTINAIGTASSSSLAGLPFSATANGGLFLTYSGSLAKSQYSYVTGQIVTGTTRIDMLEYDATTGVSAMSAAEISSGGDLYFYGNYKA